MNKLLADHMSKIGKKGGKATAKKGKAFYSRIGKLGMKKRWSKVAKKA